MKPNPRRRLLAAGAATLILLASGDTVAFAAPPAQRSVTPTAPAAPPDPTTPDIGTPYIIGGTDATHPWPGMASLQIDHKGDPNWHTCGASLITLPGAATLGRWVATNAHCVTLDDASPADPSRFHLRIGSLDRTTGGVVVDVDKVLPHATWDWATGEDPVADVAALHLTAPVDLRPFTIAAHLAGPYARTRLLGWGLTSNDATGVPVMLQQLDTRLVPAERCAAAGITAGEICVDNTSVTGTTGVGSCYGDSGGPALQRIGGRWQLIGGASREAAERCGDGPTVYTDMSYYRDWFRQVIRTGQVPPAAGRALTTTPRPAPRSLTWTGHIPQ